MTHFFHLSPISADQIGEVNPTKVTLTHDLQYVQISSRVTFVITLNLAWIKDWRKFACLSEHVCLCPINMLVLLCAIKMHIYSKMIYLKFSLIKTNNEMQWEYIRDIPMSATTVLYRAYKKYSPTPPSLDLFYVLFPRKKNYN